MLIIAAVGWHGRVALSPRAVPRQAPCLRILRAPAALPRPDLNKHCTLPLPAPPRYPSIPRGQIAPRPRAHARACAAASANVPWFGGRSSRGRGGVERTGVLYSGAPRSSERVCVALLDAAAWTQCKVARSAGQGFSRTRSRSRSAQDARLRLLRKRYWGGHGQ